MVVKIATPGSRTEDAWVTIAFGMPVLDCEQPRKQQSPKKDLAVPLPDSWLVADEKYNPYHDQLGRFSTHNTAIFHSGLRPGSGSVKLEPEPPPPPPKKVRQVKPKPEPKPPGPVKATTGEEARAHLDQLSKEARADEARSKREIKAVDDKINEEFRSRLRVQDAIDVEELKNGYTAKFEALHDQRAKHDANISALRTERNDIQKQALARQEQVRERALDVVSHPTPGKAGLNWRDTPSKPEEKAQREGLALFNRLVGPGHVDGLYVGVHKDTSGRAFYDMKGSVHLSAVDGKYTVVHEMGHWLEDRNSGVHDDALAFVERRTRGESYQKMRDVTKNKGYKDDEITKPDKFIDPYIGKRYPGGSASEVISMGLELMAKDPRKLARDDPDFFDFIFDVTRRNAKK